jgi:hypothetical protein
MHYAHINDNAISVEEYGHTRNRSSKSALLLRKALAGKVLKEHADAAQPGHTPGEHNNRLRTVEGKWPINAL